MMTPWIGAVGTGTRGRSLRHGMPTASPTMTVACSATDHTTAPECRRLPFIAASAVFSLAVGARRIGLEADLRRAGLLEQRGAEHHAPVRHVLVGFHEHRRLRIAS